MTTAQKIIKYCAVGLAVIIILSIVGVAFKTVELLSGLTDESALGEQDMILTNIEAADIKELNIELRSAGLEVKTGDAFSLTSDNEHIRAQFVGGRLSVEEEKHFWLFDIGNKEHGKVILTLPAGIELDKVELSAGAGVMDISALNTKSMNFDLGAGEVKLGYIKAERAEIDGGAGRITVEASSFGVLELDMGVGALSMDAELGSGSSVDCGVGKVELSLRGEPSDYKLSISKGIGSVNVTGLDGDGGIYGTGNKYIEINGGVGALAVEFNK